VRIISKGRKNCSVDRLTDGGRGGVSNLMAKEKRRNATNIKKIVFF
jgi:hypothetical protein